MPIAKEFTIRLEDRPGTLGKLCQALAEQDVNILAYQQFPHEKAKALSVSWWTSQTRPRPFWIAKAVITHRRKLRRLAISFAASSTKIGLLTMARTFTLAGLGFVKTTGSVLSAEPKLHWLRVCEHAHGILAILPESRATLP